MAKVCINDVRKLIEKSGQIREKLCLGTHRIGNVHIGGPMSACDVATALYYKYMEFDPENLDDPERNIFVLPRVTTESCYSPFSATWECMTGIFY